jgi:hypothetical protein
MKILKLMIISVFLLNQSVYAEPQSRFQSLSPQHPAVRDLKKMAEEFDTIKTHLQFLDQQRNQIHLSEALERLDSGQAIYIASTEANPNSVRLSKSWSSAADPIPSLLIEQFVGKNLASSVVFKLRVNSELVRMIYQKLNGEGPQDQVTNTDATKLKPNTLIHDSKNLKLVCEEGQDAATGKPMRYVSLSLGPDNVGTLLFLLLPGIGLYMMHPKFGGRHVKLMFLIAGFLGASSALLYLIGNKAGCD